MEKYCEIRSVIALFLFICHFGNIKSEKRLVFYSEIDIAQEFAKINEKIQNLTKTMSEKDKEIETLKKTVADFQNLKDSGSTYVRWGRTICAHNDTELVYHAKIKGVEYQFWAHQADGAAKFFGHNVYNDDAVCAVCYSPRSATLMIPGRTDCYGSWTKEYSGYLVSASDGDTHESDFICLDDRPEALVGGKNNDDEGILYFVEASCGKSLECPPYINGRELTCVVCSK